MNRLTRLYYQILKRMSQSIITALIWFKLSITSNEKINTKSYKSVDASHVLSLNTQSQINFKNYLPYNLEYKVESNTLILTNLDTNIAALLNQEQNNINIDVHSDISASTSLNLNYLNYLVNTNIYLNTTKYASKILSPKKIKLKNLDFKVTAMQAGITKNFSYSHFNIGNLSYTSTLNSYIANTFDFELNLSNLQNININTSLSNYLPKSLYFEIYSNQFSINTSFNLYEVNSINSFNISIGNTNEEIILTATRYAKLNDYEDSTLNDMNNISFDRLSYILED